MKQLQKSDLKVGKVYRLKAFNREYLYRISDMRTSMTLCNDGFLIININKFNKISNISQSHDFADAKHIETQEKYEFYDATPEEKHWLKVCIEADEFVSYEDAMKTFVQYYKIIESKITMNYNNNVIHEESIVFGHYNGNNRIIKAIETGKHRVFSTTDVLYGEIGDQKICFDMLALEPSTKEAYDAQFVNNEPEFVLPEKWCIKVTNENCLELRNKLPKIGAGFLLGQYIYYCNYNKNDFNDYRNWSWNLNQTKQLSFAYYNIPRDFVFSEITFDQFKQYVLKENTTVTEKPKVVFEEPKDKVLQLNQIRGKGTTIVQVQCSEGGVYKIGDKIKVFTHNSPNKGKVFTIKGFRWNNTKTKLCAITELHSPNGIGLDKIELYLEPKVEPKQELSLLEQAKLKYPIGTKFIPLNTNIICEITTSLFTKNDNQLLWEVDIYDNNIHSNGVCHYIYGTGKWAEIVEDFVLPEKWCVEVNDELRVKLRYYKASGYHHSIQINDTNKWSNKIKEGFTEITFEQFKKYVLKDE